MNTTSFQSTNEIRLDFTRAMSEMYRLEVPLYEKLLSLVESVNNKNKNHFSELSTDDSKLLSLEHHGAIRVGTAAELSMIRRLFKVMGMYPVDYYDLSIAGIPVHSTAFRAIDNNDLRESPFRVFCSLLRLDLIESDSLKKKAEKILDKRQIFPKELLKLIEISEKQEGLSTDQAKSFVANALEVFRWHQYAKVDKEEYNALKAAHGLVADIVSFKGPHINHLTPKILDIDDCQEQFAQHNIKAKAFVEGPPRRNCPILLRQTSFVAIPEKIIFSNNEAGMHTARFGEVEQRGIALTPKGRKLYDRLLSKARSGDTDKDYITRLNEAFVEFPDSYTELRQQDLAYFLYSPSSSQKISLKEITLDSDGLEKLISEELINTTPLVYQDFLPVSAAGIFSSNLSSKTTQNPIQETNELLEENANKNNFEMDLGAKVINSFELYESEQQNSLSKTLMSLGLK